MQYEIFSSVDHFGLFCTMNFSMNIELYILLREKKNEFFKEPTLIDLHIFSQQKLLTLVLNTKTSILS